jgi:hypothetical protein
LTLTQIVAPALKAVGISVNDLTLCTTSDYEVPKKTRSSIEQGIRDEFYPKTPLVVHFDGKLLQMMRVLMLIAWQLCLT